MIRLKSLNLDHKKVGLILIFSFLIAYADYVSILRFQAKSASVKKARIESLKADIASINQGLVNMQRLAGKRQEAPKIKETLTEDKLTFLLQDISDIANAQNVKIIQVKPAKDIKDKAAALLPPDFSSLAIILDLSCNYNALTKFIAALENYRILLLVQGLRIFVNTGDYLRQNVNLVLMVYIKKR